MIRQAAASPEAMATPAKPVEQIMIERALGALLPSAARNYGLPFRTPIRWFEGYTHDIRDPLDFELWVNLDPRRSRKLTIHRTLPADPEGGNRLWGCVVYEPTPPEDTEADFSETSICVSKTGQVRVEKIRFQKVPERPEYYGRFVGAEWDSDLAKDAARRAELVNHVGDTLIQAVAEAPHDQAAFFEDSLPGENPSSLSFARWGSAVAKQALAPMLATV